MRTININNKNDGKKLNTVLLNEFPALNINAVYKALRKKDIRINDVKVNDNVVVHSGDIIKVYITDDILFGNKPNVSTSIEKVYEDDNIIIVNKPAGIEVTGDNSLTSNLSEMYGFSIMPCHRLDRNTTGLTVFAKNEEALNVLFDKFKKHEIEKHYICRVYSIPREKHKILNAFLFKDNKKSMVYILISFFRNITNINHRFFIIFKKKCI